MTIETLWQRIAARIERDGGVLQRSSFEEEVNTWLAAKEVWKILESLRAKPKSSDAFAEAAQKRGIA